MRQFIHNDIMIACPEDWLDLSTVVLAAPPRPDVDFSPNVAITRDTLDEPMTPKDYAQDQLPLLQEEFGGMGYEVKSEGAARVADIPCFERMHTFVLPENELEVQQWQVYFVTGNDAVTITCTDKAANFKKSYELFQSIVAQLKVVKQ